MTHIEQEDYQDKDFSQADDLVRQRQRFLRKEKSASQIVNQLLARKGYQQQQSGRELDTAWMEIIGSQLGQKAKAGTIQQGVLEIIVTSSSVSQQLNFKKKNLLKSLQERLPQNKIKDIRFRIGSF